MEPQYLRRVHYLSMIIKANVRCSSVPHYHFSIQTKVEEVVVGPAPTYCWGSVKLSKDIINLASLFESLRNFPM
jgi:hypothetical protein